MLRKFLVLFMIISVILPMSLSQASVDETDSVGFIDSKLSEKDKEALRDVMINLDKEDRENVIQIDENDGSFTANRLELLEEFKNQNKKIIDKTGKIKKKNMANVSKINNKKVSILSYANPALPCVNATSGPYRKIRSSSGYSRITTNLYLPVKNVDTVINTSGNDKAYIYVGAMLGDDSSKQVDAGLALNWGTGAIPVPPSDETWGMTWLGMNVATGSAGNFKMGQTVFMKFYVPASNQAALVVEGYKKDDTYQSLTITFNVDSAKGFTTSGSTMKVKRITSIAQNPQNLVSGSYMNNAVWSNVKVGTTSGTEVLQDASKTSESCGYQTTNVLVDFTSYSQETIKVKAGTLP